MNKKCTEFSSINQIIQLRFENGNHKCYYADLRYAESKINTHTRQQFLRYDFIGILQTCVRSIYVCLQTGVLQSRFQRFPTFLRLKRKVIACLKYFMNEHFSSLYTTIFTNFYLICKSPRVLEVSWYLIWSRPTTNSDYNKLGLLHIRHKKSDYNKNRNYTNCY